MKLKDAVFKKCESCRQTVKRLSDETFGCDMCKQEIDMNMPGRDYLDATIFTHGDAAVHLQFCSWVCCLNKLKKVKTDSFISLPFLSFDTKSPRMHAREFFKLMKGGK
jgi:hypothetical protein